MKLHAVTLALTGLLMPSCLGTEITLRDKKLVGTGVPLDAVANYTASASTLFQFSITTLDEINRYIDERRNTTNTTSYDIYLWSKYNAAYGLAVATVCPSNIANESECSAVVQYNDELCKSASVCPFDAGTKYKQVTADCAGINPQYPSCSITCSTSESSNGAFGKCFELSVESPPPTSAPVGPTSSTPPINTRALSFPLLPLLMSWGAWIGAHLW